MIKFRDVLNSKGKQLVYLIYHLNQQRTWLLQEETWENDGRGREREGQGENIMDKIISVRKYLEPLKNLKIIK